MDSKKVNLDSKNRGSEDVASAKGNTNSTGEGMEVDTIVGNPPTPDQEDVTAECNLETVVLDPVVDKPQLDAVKKHVEMMERPVEMMTEPVNADDEVNRARLPSTPRSSKYFPDCVGGWATASADAATDTFVMQPGWASDATDVGPMDPSTVPTVNTEPGPVLVNLCVEKDSPEYNMSHPRRGKAVIFNHDTFETNMGEKRDGSDFDKDSLCTTFAQLGFDVHVKENLKCAEIAQEIEQLRVEDHANADCLVIVVMTHGKFDGQLMAYDQYYPFEQMWTSFKADRCTTLACKPKIFFVQACRGNRTDLGVRVLRTKSESQIQTDSGPTVYQLPSYADFLLAYSTMDGHYAYRNTEEGSLFIQSLCKELQENDASKVDLQRILIKTARRVALDFPNDEVQEVTDVVDGSPPEAQKQELPKQIPATLSMLIREVYFPPKPKPSEENTQQ